MFSGDEFDEIRRYSKRVSLMTLLLSSCVSLIWILWSELLLSEPVVSSALLTLLGPIPEMFKRPFVLLIASAECIVLLEVAAMAFM